MVNERYKSLEEFKDALDTIGLTAIDYLYLDYKEAFFLFSKKYHLSDDDLNDIYQDTIIAFYENILSGKLKEMTSSLKTYLFSIGKYSIYNKLKKAKKVISIDREHLENLDLSIVDQEYELSTKTKFVMQAMGQLGIRCRKILILFYYHSYTIDALKHELNYKNENVVRSHKSRCLKNLKALIKEV